MRTIQYPSKPSKTPSKPYESELTKRLREAIKSRGTNPREISKRAGCSPSAVSDILAGRSKKPSPLVLQNIATALRLPTNYFLKSDDDVHEVIPLALEPNIEVIGVAETGAYREEKGVVIKKITGPTFKRLPDVKPYALEIRDTSMDRAKPFPPAPGAFACFIKINEVGRRIEPGGIYVIKRLLSGSQSGSVMMETIVRRAVVKNGNGITILRADSSESRQYPDIVVNDLSPDPKNDVHVVGLVYAVIAFIVD